MCAYVLEPTCGPDKFKCDDGQCIDSAFRCDTLPDCPDSSDEKDCPQVQPNGG